MEGNNETTLIVDHNAQAAEGSSAPHPHYKPPKETGIFANGDSKENEEALSGLGKIWRLNWHSKSRKADHTDGDNYDDEEGPAGLQHKLEQFKSTVQRNWENLKQKFSGHPSS